MTAAVAPLAGRVEPVSSDEVDELGRGRLIGWSLLGAQLVGMLAFSTVQYSRYALSKDFGAYAQAWWEIGHGHLDPFSTLWHTPFWQNNGDFLMWPLALVSSVVPSPIVLLWLQDAVVVLTCAVAFRWAAQLIAQRSPTWPRQARTVAVVVAALVFVANPWAWETIAFDVHFEPAAGLFALLAAYDLWRGRTRRLWWWVPLCLLSESLGGLYVIGVGISGVLAGRRTRRTGLVLVAAGCSWLLAMSSIGGTGLGGHGLASWYGYLLGGHPARANALDIVLGILGHPGAVVSHLASRWAILVTFLAVSGVVGAFMPWGAGMAAVVFLPSVLNADPAFFRILQSFQIWPAIPFVILGSISFALRYTNAGALARRLAAGFAVAWLTVLAVFVLHYAVAVPRYWLAVDARAASHLASIERHLPANAEVIASQGVIGRLSERPSIFAFDTAHQRFPIDARLVVFVIAPRQGVAEVAPRDARAAIRHLERLGAGVVSQVAGVDELRWRPVGVTWVRLP